MWGAGGWRRAPTSDGCREVAPATPVTFVSAIPIFSTTVDGSSSSRGVPLGGGDDAGRGGGLAPPAGVGLQMSANNEPGRGTEPGSLACAPLANPVTHARQ